MNRTKVIIPALLILLAGCAAPAPNLDAQMGTAVEMARAQQTLHPQASQDKRPVETIDGKSADALVDRYHKGFERPQPVNIYNIGIGGGVSSTLGTAATPR
ncbi:MAG: hypothetical protein C3F18_06595 [Nitrosomonadales bacterium]|nr:MAG: hypothetical protein C3F18_06595 [Nitrosomonadales bacterium]